MAVKLRLSRIGKKKTPFYRVIAIDSKKARQARPLDILGTFDGLKGKVVTMNLEGIDKWVALGAQPTDSVKKIYKIAKKAQAATAVVA